MFNKDMFMSFYSGTPYQSSASRCFDGVQKSLTDLGIYTELTMLGAMATIRTEVGRYFNPILELADGSAYEGRVDLGNTHPGDGAKYKGRGYIQLTGRSNYTIYGVKLNLDLLNHPDIALAPFEASAIVAQYFKDRGVNVACNNSDWLKVRELVNGGTNGLDLFNSIINQYMVGSTQGITKINANTMQKLEITKVEVVGDKTNVSWHRFNDDNADNDSSSVWTFDGVLSNDEVLEKAKTMVDPGIEVSFNLSA